MKPILLCLTLLAASTGWVCAQADASAKEDQKPSVARERYDALVKEYEAARSEFGKAYAKARTDAERAKLDHPSPDQYADRMLAIVREHPGDAAALEALVWVTANCEDSEAQQTSLDLLLKDHGQSPKLADVADSLIYARAGRTEAWLRSVLKDSPHHEVKGHAAYSLGRQLIQQAGFAEALRKEPSSRTNYDKWMGKAVVDRLLESGPDPLRAEAERLLEDVAANYSDVNRPYGTNGTLADLGKSELFEIRYLAVGKIAPDIEGVDVAGKKFKLSDYRGKVVVIDFWGDW